MGCGKSSVGRELARLLCCPFVDLDSVIEERAGRSIPEIFASDGEAVFRRLEAEALGNIVAQPVNSVGPHLRFAQAPPSRGWQNANSVHQADAPLPHNRQSGLLPDTNTSIHHGKHLNAVLALGGGTVMTRECAEMVREKTMCVYLRATVETLVRNLDGENENRPMLSNEEPLNVRVAHLMALRSGTYERTAHMVIDTDGKSIADIAMEIHRNLNKIS